MTQKPSKPAAPPANSPKRPPAKTEYLTSVPAEPVEGALEAPPKREEMGENERGSKNSSPSRRQQSSPPPITVPRHAFLRPHLALLRSHHVIPSAAEESQILAPNQSRLPKPVIPVKTGISHHVIPAFHHVSLRAHHVILHPRHVIPSAGEESRVHASNPRSWPPPHPADHSSAPTRQSCAPTRHSRGGGNLTPPDPSPVRPQGSPSVRPESVLRLSKGEIEGGTDGRGMRGYTPQMGANERQSKIFSQRRI